VCYLKTLSHAEIVWHWSKANHIVCDLKILWWLCSDVFSGSMPFECGVYAYCLNPWITDLVQSVSRLDFCFSSSWCRVRNVPIFLFIFWSPPDKIVNMQCSYCFLVCYIFATLDSFILILVKWVSNLFLLKCNVYVSHPAYNIARSVVTLQHSWLHNELIFAVTCWSLEHASICWKDWWSKTD